VIGIAPNSDILCRSRNWHSFYNCQTTNISGLSPISIVRTLKTTNLSNIYEIYLIEIITMHLNIILCFWTLLLCSGLNSKTSININIKWHTIKISIEITTNSISSILRQHTYVKLNKTVKYNSISIWKVQTYECSEVNWQLAKVANIHLTK
jgi:hypothetical protein